ncbi:MAG: hypothetical protein GDA35_08255 [Hyphomonadaceae bacterium]|nr:hypothetical protein [Hyphomonadaceae bacterium]
MFSIAVASSVLAQEIVANLYVADIDEIIETGEEIHAPIVVRIPIQSVDDITNP